MIFFYKYADPTEIQNYIQEESPKHPHYSPKNNLSKF